MDASGATQNVSLSDIVYYTGPRRNAIAMSSMRLSTDHPSFGDRAAPASISHKVSHWFAEDTPLSHPSSSERTPSASVTRSITATSKRVSSSSASDAPDWRYDLLDVESACITWQDLPKKSTVNWIFSQLFPSKVEYKARDPAGYWEIDYNIRLGLPFVKFLAWILVFLVYIVLLPSAYTLLGYQCYQSDRQRPDNDWHTPSAGISTVQDSSPTSFISIWCGAVVSIGAGFLIGQGYFGLRASRERMERVRQTAITLAYSFLKTTSVDDGRYSQENLQLLIYQCLALLTAYPVALVQQINNNTCEPAVTKYCQQVACKLQKLRNGEEQLGWSPFDVGRQIYSHGHHRRQYVTVEYFFEIFSLQLESDFRQHAARSKVPSMTPQYIIYNLRNHFENIADMGNLDDRRTPIMRENIDMLALAGRECTIYAGRDVVPICLLWAVDICCRLLAFALPLQQCKWFVDFGSSASFLGFHLSWQSFAMVVACAGAMVLLAEMWALWDPFGKGVNTFSWSLGIASEIDSMLNEFYEYEKDLLVRKHAYMNPSAQRNGFIGLACSSARRPPTV